MEMIGSYVRTNKKLLAIQGFCSEKWPAADPYNHLWSRRVHNALSFHTYEHVESLKLGAKHVCSFKTLCT